MLKNIHIIINPASGQDEPILSQINRAFDGTEIKWDVSVTKEAGDAFKFAKEALTKDFDAIGVYGGDGSVVEVAEALFGHTTPLVILPGGTANVLAKEFKVPMATEEALKFLNGSFVTKTIDMARCNGKLFIVRINTGFVADMVANTDRELKDKIGQLAYGVTAVKAMAESTPYTYAITIDGKQVLSEGVALVITNCGNIGVTGMSYVPDIDMSDGLLDVLVIKRATVGSMVAMAGNALLQKKPENEVDQWKAKKISVTIPEGQTVLCDDVEIQAKRLDIEILPQAIRVLVPSI
ncbi:MAG: diacylglycerol kinase family lipid kinase [bacterium]|nr:diacylglycerol kinase family lipid kinase [bacterium]